MSLEAHHRFILYTMHRNQYIARNIINELEAENARLKAEVERLRKAGDAMLLALWLGVNEYSKEQKEKAEEEWNAANREQGCLVNPIKVAQYLPKPPTKEGKQS